MMRSILGVRRRSLFIMPLRGLLRFVFNTLGIKIKISCCLIANIKFRLLDPVRLIRFKMVKLFGKFN